MTIHWIGDHPWVLKWDPRATAILADAGHYWCQAWLRIGPLAFCWYYKRRVEVEA